MCVWVCEWVHGGVGVCVGEEGCGCECAYVCVCTCLEVYVQCLVCL